MAHIYDRRWHNYISNSLSFHHTGQIYLRAASILHLACGTGELSRLLLAKNYQQQITGVDISEKMLAIAFGMIWELIAIIAV